MTATAIITAWAPPPKAKATSTNKIKWGTLSSVSITRLTSASSRGESVANAARLSAISVLNSAAKQPTQKLSANPARVRAQSSRPSASVPSQ